MMEDRLYFLKCALLPTLQQFMRLYQIMQIKSSSYQSTPKSPTNSALNRYELRFSISNAKRGGSLDKKISREVFPSSNTAFAKTPTQSVEMPTSRKTSYSLHSHIQTSTFYPSRRQSWAALPEEPDETTPCNGQIEYIAQAFPQRRQKSGQNQLIKLLLKYSAENKKEERKHPLFNVNAEFNRGVMPKVKNFARLSWKKDRYRINRDRESGLIKETEGFDINRSTQYGQNAWLLRANLNPRKLF